VVAEAEKLVNESREKRIILAAGALVEAGVDTRIRLEPPNTCSALSFEANTNETDSPGLEVVDDSE
jgi:hypothetical protein